MITVKQLQKTFVGDNGSRTRILNGVSFTVAAGSVFTLLGPSGCGKTTSMRCIAGIEHPDEGEILLSDQVVFSGARRINLGPEKRRVGMVFQSYAIWPHMTVAENVAYPLESRGVARHEIRERVLRALGLVGLEHLADRPAPNLSGGQQQRVAVARAVVAEPEVLLLDEPLSNLDAKLREQMRFELAAMQRRLGHTVVYVTHDQEEALALSDRIALMKDGVIVEEGRPADLYNFPHEEFTASFLGAANFMEARVTGTSRVGDTASVETPFGRFTGVTRRARGDQAKVFFRPHHAVVRAVGQPAENVGTATVTDATFLGDRFELLVRAGEESLRLRAPPTFEVRLGQEIAFEVDPAFNTLFVPNAQG